MSEYKIIAKDPVMKKVMSVVNRVASVNSSILIQGASGTGKSLIARYIHNISSRADKSFVEIDCTTIPEELLESELFGHEKGAFTDAKNIKKGKFELASGGTVFIDMVSEIPIFLQGKLLRVIQERSFERLGSTQSISVDIRIITSSNRNLWDLVEAGEFREDLYYRLNVVPVDLPSLIQRKADIPKLAEYFLRKFSKKFSKSFKKFSPQAMEKLKSHNWPGNVRQLENVIERTVAIAEDNATMDEQALSFAFTNSNISDFADSAVSRMASLEEVERLYIMKVLEYTGGHRSRAAEILGINRKTLLMKRKKYGI